MANQIINLLWADDDSRDSLAPLKRRLERNSFHVKEVVDYKAALDELRHTRFDALLLDVILPYAHGRGSLEYDLGIRLANEAATKYGFLRNIAFLTVVQEEEDVTNKYKTLCEDHKGRVNFQYFDKTKLLEPGYIGWMMQFLKQ